jgi:signal transduction histidine kinase
VIHTPARIFGPAVELRERSQPDLGVEQLHPRVDDVTDLRVHPRAGNADPVQPYSFRVTAGAATPKVSLADAAGLDPVTYRWMRPLAVVALGVVVTAAFNTDPAPGAHGQHLAVSATLVVFAVGTMAVVRLPIAPPIVQLPLLIVVVLSAAALVGLQPNGPGFLGVFPAVSAAALRLPVRPGVTVAGVAVTALAVAWSRGGNHPVAGIILNEFGVVAFYLLATVARRFREANERTQQLIVELEQTRAAQAQAAALGERQRLAREMHDVLAHSLSGLVLNLEGARLLAERGDADPKVADAIGRAHRLAKTGLEEARNAIGMLRDNALPGPERLDELAAEFENDSGTVCTFAVNGEQRGLSSDSRLTLYRVAQEALTNIRKHACPERVELHLTYEPAGTRLTIEDFQAHGSKPRQGDGTGYGLTGMRERAELLGGTLTADATTEGFRVELWVPA